MQQQHWFIVALPGLHGCARQTQARQNSPIPHGGAEHARGKIQVASHGRSEVEEAVGACYVADANGCDVAQPGRAWVPGHVPVERANGSGQHERSQSAVPECAPLSDGHLHELGGRDGGLSERFLYRKPNSRRASAETFGIQDPAIFGERWKELLSDSYDLDNREAPHEIVQQGRAVRGVADLGGHDKRHTSSGFKQTGCSHEEWSPRRREAGELSSCSLAELKRAGAYVAIEGLITDERRVPCRAFEAVICVRSPCKEVVSVDRRPRRTSPCFLGGLRILLDANTVVMACY